MNVRPFHGENYVKACSIVNRLDQLSHSFELYLTILSNLHLQKSPSSKKIIINNLRKAVANYYCEVDNCMNAYKTLDRLTDKERSKKLEEYQYRDNSDKIKEIYERLDKFYNGMEFERNDKFLVCGDIDKCGVEYNSTIGSRVYIGDITSSNKKLVERFSSEKSITSICNS